MFRWDVTGTPDWIVRGLSSSVSVVYLFGAAHDGPDSTPVLIRSVDELDNIYGTYFSFQAVLRDGQYSLPLPFPCAREGGILSDPPLSNVRVISSQLISFDPVPTEQVYIIRYVLRPGIEGYLPAVGRLLLGLGVQHLACVRIPGKRASATISGWRVESKYSGSIYNGCKVRLSPEKIIFISHIGDEKVVNVEPPVDSFLLRLPYESDFPVVLIPPDPAATSIPVGLVTLSNGVAQDYTQEGLIDLVREIDLPWPGIIVPAGSVSDETLSLIYSLRRHDCPLMISFPLPNRVYEEMNRLPVRRRFGLVPSPGRYDEPFSSRCSVGYDSVILRFSGVSEYIRASVPDTDCPRLPQVGRVNEVPSIDVREPFRWSVVGNVDTTRGWYMSSKDQRIQCLHPVYRTMAVDITSQVDTFTDKVGGLKKPVQIWKVDGWKGLVMRWGSFGIGFGIGSVSSAHHPGRKLLAICPVVIRSGQLTYYPNSTVGWPEDISRVHLRIVRLTSGKISGYLQDPSNALRIFSVQNEDAPSGDSNEFEFRWMELGSPPQVGNTCTIRKVQSTPQPGSNIVTWVRTPVVDFGYPVRVHVSVDADGAYTISRRAANTPFANDASSPPWLTTPINDPHQYWQVIVSGGKDTLVRSVSLEPVVS